MASKTKFEINSIEKKNGIRVIEYTPSSNTHPEVEDFINQLKGIKTPLIANKVIDTTLIMFRAQHSSNNTVTKLLTMFIVKLFINSSD